jgi:hypothetical protein
MLKTQTSGIGIFWEWCSRVFSVNGLSASLAVTASAFLLMGQADAKTIFVNGANATPGDGTTWAKSFKFLRDALDLSAAGDQIFVAKGTYYPDDGASGFIGDRELAFELKGVKLYGGFAGGESNIFQRDTEANLTVLSGEIWPITPETLGYERYWALHVVVLNGNSTLDGVTIEKGRANGDEPPFNQGGGIYVPASQSVTLVDCILNGNLACESGGAIWGKVDARGCTFFDNLVDNEFLKTESKIRPQRAWIYNAKCFGGAINGDVKASDCKFTNNIVNTSSLRDGTTTAATGGAISGKTISLRDCVFDGNKATSISYHFPRTGSDATSTGGAVSGSVSAVNCRFINNLAEASSSSWRTAKAKPTDAAVPYTSRPETYGGAIAGQITASNCIFDNNETNAIAFPDPFVGSDNTDLVSIGGALYVENTSTLINCLFHENENAYEILDGVAGDPVNLASAAGGAAYASETAVMPVLNCTFLDNITAGTATAIYVEGNVNILSNIFWYTAPVDPFFPEVLISVATGDARSRISNRLYPTPSTETINIVKAGIDGVDIAQANADFGEPPERTLLNPDTPIFVDETEPSGLDGIWGTEDDGLRLADASVAIGKGHPLFVPKDILDVDQDGNIIENVPVDVANYARIQNSTLDLGAYEYGDNLLAPEIQVEQAGGSTLVDNSGTVTFSAAPGLSDTKTFTIRNVGALPLKNIRITKDGTNSDDFEVTQPTTNAIGAGGGISFTVVFKPTVSGPRTAALHISSNDTDENPFDIAMYGELLLPDISVEIPAGTPLVDNTSTVSYGTVPALTSVSKTFSIRNTGPGTLKINGVVASGGNAAEFKVTPPAFDVLSTGSVTTFKVTFTPTAAGTRSSSIIVQSNDPDAESSFLIKITGNATVNPEIAVFQPSSTALVDGGSKSFGSVKTGLSYTKTFTIKNYGSTRLKDINVTITGANAARFKLEKPTVTGLDPSEKTTFTVTFKPTSNGLKLAVINIASNDADENPFNINIDGTGISGSSSKKRSALVADSGSVSGSGGSVTSQKSGDGLEYLVLTVKKDAGWSLTKHSVEVSSNLVDWFSGTKHTTILADDANILRVRDDTPVGKDGKRYIRLK